jgi:integrase
MATIQRHVSKRTGAVTYSAQVRTKGRRPEFATFPNRKDAKEWGASIEAAIRENRHFPHAAAKRTNFDSLAEDYVATVLPDFDPKGRATREKQLKWWSRQFAGLSLAEITPDRIARARDKLAAEPFTRGKARTDRRTGQPIPPKQYKRTGSTVNRYTACLSAALSFAVKDRGLIERNPVSSISKKKEPRGRTRFLSDEERTGLLDACTRSSWPELQTLVMLAITTGARKGELTNLRWSDVDLKVGRALVRESKNDEQRTLPLAGKALEALRNLKLQNSSRSEYVFAQPSGFPGPYVHFDSHWYAALDRAGIRGDFHFHDLRHTCASYLARQGCSLLEIANVLGHKTLAMVKRYAHLVHDDKARAIEKMITSRGL